jgi:hypothetical protein
LRPYLLRSADAHCFSSAESEIQRLAERHAARKTPLSYGNSPGTNRKSRPKRQALIGDTAEKSANAPAAACTNATG